MKKIIFHPLAVFFSTLCAVVFFVSLSHSAQRNSTIANAISELNHEITLTTEKNKQLKKELYIATSSAEKERMIREELLQQKPGEIIFILPKEKKEHATKKENTTADPLEQWKILLGLLDN